MKLYVKFLLFILVLGMAGPFILKGPDGKPWMELADITPDFNRLSADMQSAINKAGRMFDKTTSSDPNAGTTKVYKWRDSSGNWHLSDQPIPEAAGRDKLMHVDPDTNLIEGSEPIAVEVEQSRADGVSNAVPLPMTVSPGQATKLLDDAKAVQGLMDDRAKQLDGI